MNVLELTFSKAYYASHHNIPVFYNPNPLVIIVSCIEFLLFHMHLLSFSNLGELLFRFLFLNLLIISFKFKINSFNAQLSSVCGILDEART